jgi:hypothetical protein
VRRRKTSVGKATIKGLQSKKARMHEEKEHLSRKIKDQRTKSKATARIYDEKEQLSRSSKDPRTKSKAK